MYSEDVIRLNPALAAEPRPRAPRAQPEAAMQMALIQWRDTLAPQYPILRRLAHWPNGEYRSPVTAARLVALGVQPGPPDLWLCVPRGEYPGLVIELKVRPNDLSADQLTWKAWLMECGYVYATVYDDWTQAAAAIVEWCGLPEELVP